MLEKNQIYHLDCLEGLKQLSDNSIDSIVTDPPYELGFMGKKWDSTGIAYNVELWKEALRVLKHGGHLLAFGGTRTYHRLAVAIEDAGFEIRDQIQWIYGSGFPKSHNISKSIDKKFGAEREVIGKSDSKGIRTGAGNYVGDDYKQKGYGITIPSTDLAKQYDGFGTALKPAHEPIVVARKHLSEKTIVENVLKWGTGGINIDDSRVKFKDNNEGRFPANVILDEEAGKMLDEQSGNRPSGKGNGNAKVGETSNGSIPPLRRGKLVSRNDKGGASRFFYQAKASKKERGEGNNHPTVKPLKLMEYLVRLVTPPNGIVLDPFVGSGTTLLASKNLGFNFIGFEKEKEYVEIAKSRLEHSGENESI